MTPAQRKLLFLVVFLVLPVARGFSLWMLGADLMDGIVGNMKPSNVATGFVQSYLGNADLTGPVAHAEYRFGVNNFYDGALYGQYGLCPKMNSSHQWMSCAAKASEEQRAPDTACRWAGNSVSIFLGVMAVAAVIQAVMKQWPGKARDSQQQADDRQQLMKDEIRVKILEELRQDLASAVINGLNMFRLQPQPVYLLPPPQPVFQDPQPVGVPLGGLPMHQSTEGRIV